MTKQEIYENLCSYDKRNPYYDAEYPKKPRPICYCDNCFNGRNKLALEILRYWTNGKIKVVVIAWKLTE